MAPMIDVIFLLLVFFVCTASFRAIELGLPTNLQLTGTVDAETPIDPELVDLDEIIIRLNWADERPSWEINEKRYDRSAELGRVVASVARLQPDLPVILDVDPNVPLGKVIDLYDLCRGVGLQKIAFAASENGS